MSFSFLEELWDRVSDYVFPAPNPDDFTTTPEFILSDRAAAGLRATPGKYLYANVERKTLDRCVGVQLSDSNSALEFFDDQNSAAHFCPGVFSQVEIIDCCGEIERDKRNGRDPDPYLRSKKFITIVIRADMFADRLKRIGNSHYVLQPPLDKTKDVFATAKTKFDCLEFVIHIKSEKDIDEKLAKCEFQITQM